MIRRLFTLLSAVSLLLCISTVLLWARSHRVADYFDWRYDEPGRAHLDAQSLLGTVYVWRVRNLSPAMTPSPAALSWHTGRARPRAGWTVDMGADMSEPFVGFSYSRTDVSMGGMGDYGPFFEIPHWALTVASSLLPGSWVLALLAGVRRNRRRVRGLCPGCGYDLRATPERCPECGAVSARTFVTQP